MKLIAIDPGIMTGFVYARIDDNKQLSVFPFQMVDAVDDFWRRLFTFAPDIIVMEDFEFRKGARAGLELFPVQLIGIANLYYTVEPSGRCQLHMQSASYGKQYYNDTMLKKHEVYKRGVPHGMDALRHLLQWVTFSSGFQYVDLKTGEKVATLLTEWESDDNDSD